MTQPEGRIRTSRNLCWAGWFAIAVVLAACNAPVDPAPAEPDGAATPLAPVPPQARATPAAPAADVPDLRPLTSEQRSLFFDSPDEPAPVAMADDIDYVHTNETRHDLYFPFIEGLGGGYLGVGSDQNYLLAARARSEWVWLLDYNIEVTRMHQVVRALVLEAPDARSYQGLWHEEQGDRARGIIEAAYRDDPHVTDLVETYGTYRARVDQYHKRMLPRAREGWVSLWLHDENAYDHLRDLFQADRVRMLRGDLLGTKAMQGIGGAARKLGVTVRVVYLSNAESFFDYEPSFRENMAALPIDDRSVVLRTAGARALKRSQADFRWHYNVQKALHFAGLLRDPTACKRVYDVLHLGHETRIKGLSATGFTNPECPALPSGKSLRCAPETRLE